MKHKCCLYLNREMWQFASFAFFFPLFICSLHCLFAQSKYNRKSSNVTVSSIKIQFEMNFSIFLFLIFSQATINFDLIYVMFLFRNEYIWSNANNNVENIKRNRLIKSCNINPNRKRDSFKFLINWIIWKIKQEWKKRPNRSTFARTDCIIFCSKKKKKIQWI